MDNVVVHKYGGSSLETPGRDLNVVHNIARAKKRGENIVVVCSAKGGVTQRLKTLCDKILVEKIDTNAAQVLAWKINSEHMDDAEVHELDFPFDVATDLNTAYKEMVAMQDEKKDVHLLSLLDRIEGIGERFKVRQIAALGRKCGLNTVACEAPDVGFITDDNFRNAKVPCSQYGTIKKSLEGLLGEGKIPVVTGFIGKTADGRYTTGGYNSSDLWATIIGAALDAKEVRIYNAEIHALYSINPSIADKVFVEPRIIHSATYKEADEFSREGGKLHPASVKPAQKKKVPVRVLNVFDTSDPSTRGTLIGKAEQYTFGQPRVFTSTYVTLVNVHLSEMDSDFGYAAKVYNALAKLGINAEMGDASSNTAVRVAFDADASISDIVYQLEKEGICNDHVTFTKDVVQIYCVGNGLGKKLNKVITRVHKALDHAEIDSIMVGSGASASTYGVIVQKEHEFQALRALHNEFYPD